MEILMANGNRITCDMKPHLETIQFCPLKDKEVWRNIRIQQASVHWEENPGVELSIDRLLELFIKDERDGREAAIWEATSNRTWQLQLRLRNGNRLS